MLIFIDFSSFNHLQSFFNCQIINKNKSFSQIELDNILGYVYDIAISYRDRFQTF